MVLVPVTVGRVEVDVGFFKACMVVFDRHVEDTVVSVLETKGVLHIFGDIIPLCAAVAPGSFVPLRAPRVPNLDESLSWDFCGDADDSVGVTFSETIILCVEMGLALFGSCGCLNDLMGDVMFQKLGPESINGGDHLSVIILVVKFFIRAAEEIPDSLLRPSTHGVLVVTMELCEGFLDDGTPN